MYIEYINENTRLHYHYKTYYVVWSIFTYYYITYAYIENSHACLYAYRYTYMYAYNIADGTIFSQGGF